MSFAKLTLCHNPFVKDNILSDIEQTLFFLYFCILCISISVCCAWPSNGSDKIYILLELIIYLYEFFKKEKGGQK